MKVDRHAPPTFLKHAEPLIAEAPADNHLLAALAHRLMEGNLTLNAPPVLVTVSDGARPVLAALRTPPGNLVLSAGPKEAALALADGLRDMGVAIPGVTGPKATTEPFAQRWNADRELVYLARVRACSALDDVTSAEGELRAAQADEVELLGTWLSAFRTNVFSEARDPIRFAKRRIADEALFVWDDGGPVSMACVDGNTGDTARVDWIYTPDEKRGRGYAKSAVAALTTRLLAAGCKLCIAHAVTADTRANALLEGIGYRAVSVSATWRF